jgi:hypothetical protein
MDVKDIRLILAAIVIMATIPLMVLPFMQMTGTLQLGIFALAFGIAGLEFGILIV